VMATGTVGRVIDAVRQGRLLLDKTTHFDNLLL
jgi:hypothetical protein